MQKQSSLKSEQLLKKVRVEFVKSPLKPFFFSYKLSLEL